MAFPIRPVVVTGIGAVTPLGVGARFSWSRLIDGKTGVTAYRNVDELKSNPCQVAAYVPPGTKASGGWDSREWIDAGNGRRMATFTQYALAAAHEALTDARWLPSTAPELESTGVCIGSGIGSLEDGYDTALAFEKGGYRQVSPLFVPRLLVNLAAGHVSMKYGFQGPNLAPATACTSGLHAIGDAARLIATGEAEVMVAGGAEACIHPLAMAGFARARSLTTDWNHDPGRASRPFDTRRSGFVIGEGAGVVVLESLSHARRRSAHIHAQVRGYGLSGDAHHITAPRSDGQGPFLAMKRALERAGIKPRQVDYVNAHATSTIQGDAAENHAIRRLLLGLGSEHDERSGWNKDDFHKSPRDVNVSSTKGATGHLLGAAGAVEAVFTIMALNQGILPPTLNLDEVGNPAGTGASEHESVFDCNYVAGQSQDVGKGKVKVALTNSFGFGGTNASLCLSGPSDIDGTC